MHTLLFLPAYEESSDILSILSKNLTKTNNITFQNSSTQNETTDNQLIGKIPWPGIKLSENIILNDLMLLGWIIGLFAEEIRQVVFLNTKIALF